MCWIWEHMYSLGGEKKSSAKPCFVRSQLDSDRCLFIHICTLHVQEMNTSCAGAPAAQTRGEHMNSTEKDPCRSFLMWSNSATNQSPHAALKSWSCKAIHCVCQMNAVENKVLNFPLKYNEVKVLTKWKYSILYTVGSEEVKPVHGGHSTHYMTEDHRVPLVACSVTHHVLEHVPPEPQC